MIFEIFEGISGGEEWVGRKEGRGGRGRRGRGRGTAGADDDVEFFRI